MSIPYRIMYGLGLTPWEHADPPPVLVDLVSGPDALPKGRMLDVGCGTGGDAIWTAGHGWEVTGVDIVPRALRKAGVRASAAGADIRLIRGDITTADVGDGYSLVLDGGCLHDLTPAALSVAAARITAATVPGAQLIMFAFTPARRGALPRGLSAGEAEAAFSGWRLTGSRPADDVALKGPAAKADPRWHLLTRA